MKLPDDLTPEAQRALIECIKIFAQRGRQLREERERAEKANPHDVGTLGLSLECTATKGTCKDKQ